MSGDESAQIDAVGSPPIATDVRLLRHQYKSARDADDLRRMAEVACRLADLLATDTAAQRTAANALFQLADYERSRTYAGRAYDLSPDVYGLRLFTAKVYLKCEDPSGALLILAPAFELPDRTAELYHVASQAAEALGDGDLAVSQARKAWELEPERPARGLALANLLGRLDRVDEAKTVFERCAENAETAGVALRGLSGLLAKDGALEEALEAIDAALAIDQERADFQLHRVGLLRRLGHLEDARLALQVLMASQPDDLRLKRTLVSVYVHEGNHDAALRAGAELLAAAPDVDEYIKCMQSLLQHREHREDTKDDGPDIATLKRANQNRRYREKLTYAAASRRTGEIIFALVLREIRTRYGRNRLSFIWALVEPMAHIGVLAALFFVMDRSNPPLGSNFLLFYFTGVQPFLIFSNIAQKAGGGITSARGLMQLPQVTPLDIVFSKAIVEVIIALFVVVAFGAVLTAFGVMGFPTRPGYVLGAFVIASLFGIGIGQLMAVAQEFGRAIDIALRALFRVLYLSSGIFFLPGDLPQWVREILLWNPCLHILDLWRLGYYPQYTAPFMDPLFAILCAIGALMLGMVIMMFATPWLRSVK